MADKTGVPSALLMAQDSPRTEACTQNSSPARSKVGWHKRWKRQNKTNKKQQGERSKNKNRRCSRERAKKKWTTWAALAGAILSEKSEIKSKTKIVKKSRKQAPLGAPVSANHAPQVAFSAPRRTLRAEGSLGRPLRVGPREFAPKG